MHLYIFTSIYTYTYIYIYIYILVILPTVDTDNVKAPISIGIILSFRGVSDSFP